jgi:hypothetical protein
LGRGRRIGRGEAGDKRYDRRECRGWREFRHAVNYWDKVTDRQGEDKKSTITTYITKDWSGKREFVKIINH